jgi:hypothetical protein
VEKVATTEFFEFCELLVQLLVSPKRVSALKLRHGRSTGNRILAPVFSGWGSQYGRSVTFMLEEYGDDVSVQRCNEVCCDWKVGFYSVTQKKRNLKLIFC